jgi:uncharacterized protein with FMN-binding domain
MRIFALYNKWGAHTGMLGKRRIISLWRLLFVTALPALILFGCAVGLQHHAGIYMPGIYKGVGEGMHGDIVVETEFSASGIIAVKVVSHEDTPIISDAAVKTIPAAVLKTQKAEVDAVTGATVTSEGIKLAIQSTISQALRK